MTIRFKRVYGKSARADGYRVLVDRLWPRGLTKADAAVDLWFKDTAPSTELRKWFGHEPERVPEFERRYRRELEANSSALEELRSAISGRKQVTLLYSARSEDLTHARILAQVLAD